MFQRTTNGGQTKGLEGACSVTQSGSSSPSSLFLLCFINIFVIIIITIIIIMAIATSAKIRLTHAGPGENSMFSPMYSHIWLSTHIEYAHNKLLSLMMSTNVYNQSSCVLLTIIAWLSLNWILERSWVALYSVVCVSVRHRCHPTKSPLFPIYTGIQALCWPNTT